MPRKIQPRGQFAGFLDQFVARFDAVNMRSSFCALKNRS